MNKDMKILIVGLGVIGASYASKLSSSGYTVYGIDKDEEVINYATDNKIISNNNLSYEEKINCSDLIVLCIYPNDIINWIRINKIYFKNNVVITDTCGVKKEIIKQVNEELDNKFIYLSHHPMAGREEKGILFSNQEIFKNANFLIIPSENNNEYEIELLKELGITLGFSNVEIIDALKHDEVIGYLSQLTHVIAVCLMNAHNNDSMVRYTGDSFRDLTRIAKINEDLWYQLFNMNKNVLLKQIDDFEKILDDFKEKLRNNKEEEIKKLLISSTVNRKKFDKK